MADKFKTTFYVTSYLLARDGLSDQQIGKSLGVTGKTFRDWCLDRPALREAVALGRAGRGPQNEVTFPQYVYDHLSPNLRKLWEEINACEDLENGIERIDALLQRHGVRARQHLFLYALTQSMFNVSQSLRKLGIARKSFEDWRANDPDFAELMDEIHWHKKNFFEQAFIGRVAAGDTAAVIHAVKTQCRDRGYNERVEMVHSGTISVGDTIDITTLDLDVETRRKVLDAIRAQRAANEGEAAIAAAAQEAAEDGA